METVIVSPVLYKKKANFDHFPNKSGFAAPFVALSLMLEPCPHILRGPVASTATSMTLSGTNHCRSSRKRKSRTAMKAKTEPATGPQWDLSLSNRLSRGSTSSVDTLSYTYKRNRQFEQLLHHLCVQLWSVCHRSCLVASFRCNSR